MLGKEPHHSSDKTWSFACSDLWHYLKKLGTAESKYIPEEVKGWGREELEAFLHFYLLGDGWQNRNKAGEKEYWRAVTVSRRLADDLQEIAQKVGLSATITPRQPRDANIEGRHIPAERQRVGYYLCFNKAETRRIRTSRSHYKGNVYCVSVPNEVLYVRRGGSPTWCGNTAPTTAQVRAILWRYIRRMHKAHSLPGRVNQVEWLIDEELVAFGRKPADADESSFVGIHAPYVLVVLDEACGIPESLWIGAEAITTGPWCRILAIGNPDNSDTHFYTVSQPGSGWNALKISAFDTPNFTGEKVPEKVAVSLISREWAEEKKMEWGEGNALYNSKILGEFSVDSADTVVRSSDVAACRVDPEARYTPADLSPIELGVDVGGGSDETVIRERRGILAGREWRIRTDRPEKIAPLVLRALRESRATSVKIDSIGVGFGVIGELRNAASRHEHNARIIGVNVASNPRDKKKFKNLRAEMWWEIGREMSAQGLWDLSSMENADVTCAQLLWPRWFLDLQGRIQVESKDDIIKRNGRSPDNSDALLLSYFSGATPRIRILR